MRDQGYVAKGGQIIDASIVPVPRQHNTKDENKQIKAGEVPGDWADKPAKARQKDTDARWTKKNGKSHYGDKNPINADRRYKLVRLYDVTRGMTLRSRMILLRKFMIAIAKKDSKPRVFSGMISLIGEK